jgi:hypothetical protein
MSNLINYTLSAGPAADSVFECGPEFIPENMESVLLEVAFHYASQYYWASFWITVALFWVSGLVLIIWRVVSHLYWGWVMFHNDGWHAYLIAEQMRLALEEEERDMVAKEVCLASN